MQRINAITRLLVHVEGNTEKEFVDKILRPHLYLFGYSDVSSRLMGNNRESNQRGGVKPWPEVRNGIVNHLLEDPGAIAGTMVDYYGMPQRGPGAWPGRAGAPAQFQFPNELEELMLADVRVHMGSGFNPARFIPYVMMHEFEAMLFSDCAGFANSIGYPNLTSMFQGIRDGFNSPEEINDSPSTAPSKRIEALIPQYRKPVDGILAAQTIGLPAIRAECGHFRGWLERLERLLN